MAYAEINALKERLAAVERENRAKCLELAEKAFEIRELRGVVDAAAAFVEEVDFVEGGGIQLAELQRRLDALDLTDDAPRSENPDAGYVVWHRLDGYTMRLWPISRKIEVLNPALRLEVNFSEPGLPAVRQEIHCEGQPVERCDPPLDLITFIERYYPDLIPGGVDPRTLHALTIPLLRINSGRIHTGAPGNSVDTRVERDPEP